MKPMFLSNGQACYLREKIGDKYLVNKVFEFDSEEGMQEVVDENSIVVNAVFDKPPTAKINEEIKIQQERKAALSKDMSRLTDKIRSAKIELEQLQKTQVSKSKFIINRTDILNAKTLVLFTKDCPMPITMDSSTGSFRALRLSMEVRISDGVERYWGYKLTYDNSWSSGDFLCEKYGILIDPTQEQIEETIMKRLAELDFRDYYLVSVPEKYLNEAQKARVNEYKANEMVKRRAELEKQIKDAQDKLEALGFNA